ncbi:MAG: hypothetical protein C0432_02175 [Candidatus Puniceispirillum sp.]|nr:hypothetical protein [Candidatus Pelagibacter sp.]MBA4283082.1 hypothetical protein [Candidatus Puniceispirillum sp.]
MTRLIFSAILLGITFGIVGCFLMWMRHAFLSDALSHSAILGVSISVLFGISPLWGITGIGLLIALSLYYHKYCSNIPKDSWLNLISYSFLGLGYTVTHYLAHHKGLTLGYLESILFGDILLINNHDLQFITFFAIFIVCIVFLFWKMIIRSILDTELAQIHNPKSAYIFPIFLGILVILLSLTLPKVGALLVPGMLIMPACCAALIAKSPEKMIFIAVIISISIFLMGIFAAFQFDFPISPMAVICGFGIFIGTIGLKRLMSR